MENHHLQKMLKGETMSELTQCNFCSMKQIRENLKSGEKIFVTAEYGDPLKGKSIYILPVGVEALKPKEHFVAWFMEIGKRCEC